MNDNACYSRLPAHAAVDRAAALSDEVLRSQLRNEHPLIVDTDCLMYTPMIQQIYDICASAIANRTGSFVFAGRKRVGKTRAMRLVFRELEKAFPEVLFLRVIATGRYDSKERGFYETLYATFDEEADPRDRAEVRRQTIKKAWISAARARRANCIVLRIDEIQDWGPQEMTWLKAIGNQLEEYYRLALLAIAAGSEEVAQRKRALGSQTRGDLIGRFMATILPVHGFRSAEELEAYLVGFDDAEKYCYPPGTGISYTEFFVPAAYLGGFRLATQAPALWRVLCEFADREHEFGMQRVSSTVKTFFNLLAHDQQCASEKVIEHWRTAVQAAPNV